MKRIEVIDELRRVASKLDCKCLSPSEYQRHGTISSGAVEKTFGSWNEAILAAGLTPLPQGGMPIEEQRRRGRVADPPTAGSGVALRSELIRSCGE